MNKKKNTGKKGARNGRGSHLQWYNYDIPTIAKFLEIHVKHEGLEATLKGIEKFKDSYKRPSKR